MGVTQMKNEDKINVNFGQSEFLVVGSKGIYDHYDRFNKKIMNNVKDINDYLSARVGNSDYDSAAPVQLEKKNSNLHSNYKMFDITNEDFQINFTREMKEIENSKNTIMNILIN